MGGYSRSGISGDKTQISQGFEDYWIVKTDSSGAKQWDARFGGNKNDELYSLKQTLDSGYILGGVSSSGISGDKTLASQGNSDYWILKTDPSGIKQWDAEFGGTDDDHFYSLEQTSDSGYLLAGWSLSGISGDKTQASQGGKDYWIVKTDSSGVKQWDARFGGTDDEDEFGTVEQTNDGGYLIAGTSYSPISGNKTESNLGVEQTWIIKTDFMGSKVWDKTNHSAGHDEKGLAIQTNDGCFVLANDTWAGIGGDKTQDSWGGNDYWVIKFCDTTGLPKPQSTFNCNSNSGCPNSCFDFTNTSLNATSYQWFFTGGNPASSTQQNPSNICYANPGVYDVMLIASSNFASDTLTLAGYITIFTPLAISISQSGNFLSCNPAASSYQWLLDGNQIPGATSQTLFINQTGNYSIEIIDSNGCVSSALIYISSVPSPIFSVDDNLLCEKFCTNFFDQSTNTPTAWQWIFAGANPSSSTDQNPTNICYNEPGTYDVTLITTNAFGNDTLTLSNYITVYATPSIPTITQIGYTLTSSVAASYQWQLNAVDISGATNQSYNVLQTGLYSVVVGDSNGCVNAASQYVLISGIDEVSSDQNLFIYPNPSSGSFTIEMQNDFSGKEILIEVINPLGQKIFSKSENVIGASFQKEIQLLFPPAGIYLVKIVSGDKTTWQKVLVE